MKKIKVLTMLAIITLSVMGANAQEKGDMAIGANAVVGSFADGKNSVDFGIGARFMYNVSDPIRLDGSFNYYLGESAPFDFSVNAHYLINIMPKLNVYPLVGLSIFGYGDNEGEVVGDTIEDTIAGGLGLNLGGGAEYQIVDKIWGNAELKYNVGMGFAACVGVAYKF